MRLLLVLILASVLGGCFKEPRPKCSFLCGPAGECPEGYACDPGDLRCHLFENGAPATCEDTLPPDSAPIADGTVDVPPLPDGVPDGSVDATSPAADAAELDSPPIDAEIADATID